MHHRIRPPLEGLVDASSLSLIQLIRGLSSLGGVQHNVNQDLAVRVWAQANRHCLVDLILNLSVDTNKFHVTASLAALPDETLGGTVERHKLDIIVGATHALQNLLERMERQVVDVRVRLVDFISQEDKFFAVDEVDDLTHVTLSKTLTSGVTGVDHSKSTHIDTIPSSLLNRSLKLGDRKTPRVIFFEVVVDGSSVKERKSGRVKRILRNRDHDTDLGSRDECLKDGLNAAACAVAKEDAFGIRTVAIALLDELGNSFTNALVALGVRIGTDVAALVEDLLGSLYGIFREELRNQNPLALVEEIRVVH
eukprot:Colp12_sorted_trinity150504_noHs@30807